MTSHTAVNHTVRSACHANGQWGPPLTFEEWLQGQPLPEGFDKIKHGYPHWDQCAPLSWAIHCFLKKNRART